MLAPAPATADPLTDLIGSLLAGPSDGGNAQPGPGGPSKNGVVGIEVKVEKARSGPGSKLGPDLYALSNNGRFEPGVEFNADVTADPDSMWARAVELLNADDAGGWGIEDFPIIVAREGGAS